MKTNRIFIIFLGILLTALLVACGGTADPPPPTAIPETITEAAPEVVEEAAPGGSGQTYTIGAEANESHTYIVTDASQAAYIVDEEFLADALEKLGIAAGDKVVVGTTPGITGEIQLNFGDPDLLEAAQFTVDMSGLKTDQNRRDKWLRENAIETDFFPEATFVATAVSGLPETYVEGETISFQLNGNLTVRDKTNPVTFEVEASLDGGTLQGTATLPLQMTDFGITPPNFANTLTVADGFKIEVSLVAEKQ